MGKLLSSALLWQLVAGFALGTLGVLALQPVEARQALLERAAAISPGG
ncbi:MAG: hypothetical protein ACKVOB_12210 [Sphingomonas sp.]